MTAELPVRAEPPPPGPAILTGCDGSDASLWALDRAMTEAEAHGLPLHVLAVVNPSPTGYPPGMADLVQESVERLTASMSDGLRRAVATVQAARPRPYAGELTLHVVLGNVVDLLLRAAAGRHTLVLGTRGNGGFARLLLGSVSTAAVHHATCPVLVVPPPAAEG
ncbi:universal stress protein [Kitasatospora sp. NPDC088391]|uniref:universal stress protein n=1 Tax=Kitasatospora sp. NPDC088391 TaxID=3364074 RepID=UPI003821A170